MGQTISRPHGGVQKKGATPVRKVSLALVTMLTICACVSNQVFFTDTASSRTRPDLEDYLSLNAFGLAQNQSIDLQKICMDQKPTRASVHRSPIDSLITVLSLSIYSPLTLRVWCGP